MHRRWLGSLAGALMLALGCGDDNGEGDGTDEGTGTESSTGTTPTTTTASTMTASTMTASTTATSSSTSTGPDTDTGSTGTSVTGDVTSDTDSSDTGSGSSSTGTPVDDYPSCEADEDCSDPYTLCWPPMEFGTPNYCTVECEDAEADCPVPTSGTAVPVCEGPPGTDICSLDCTDGDCPDGMDCIEIFMLMRCSWPA
jgi:hypothetical protein